MKRVVGGAVVGTKVVLVVVDTVVLVVVDAWIGILAKVCVEPGIQVAPWFAID